MQKSVLLALLFTGAVLGALAAGGALSGERKAYFWQNGEPRAEETISVLILGRVAEGQGGRWHRAPDLTDAIVLFYYRPETGVANLISLPRDLYGDFGDGYFKLNEVYRYGAVETFLREKLPEITSIQTDKYAVVDAGIIERGVDALGGIDITLDAPVTDPVSGYRLEAGEHHLDGEDTVWLLRNRYAPEGDFFREKNQQAVVEAVARRYQSLSAPQRTKFLLQMAPELGNAEANFSLGELAPTLGGVKELAFNGIVLDFATGLLRSAYTSELFSASAPDKSALLEGETSTTTTDRGAYVLIPTEGINNYTAIRQFISERIR